MNSRIPLLVGALLPGCGGGSSGRVDTGLPETQLLSDVSATEAAQACERVRSAVRARFVPEQTLRKVCELVGAGATDSTPECETQADSCVDESQSRSDMLLLDQLDFAESVDCNRDVSDLAECDASVGELETCLNDQVDSFSQTMAEFDCANAASIDARAAASLISDLLRRAAPESCERLVAECPAANFFGDPRSR